MTSEDASVEVLADGLAFPEGPAFAPDGNLWLVELQGGRLARWSDEGLDRHEVGGSPNGLLIDGRGRAWIANSGLNAIQLFDPETGAIEAAAERVDGAPLAGPNDLAFDPEGNLVFTCPAGSSDAPVGSVCCLGPDGTVTTVGEGFRFPNGLAFVDGGTALVVAETQERRLWKGAWDAESRTWGDPEPWAEVGGPEGPDGMALGADGLLYVAVFGLGQVKAVRPDGAVAAVYDLPGGNPTNVAFDPGGRLGLVVTEAERGLLLSLPGLGKGAPLSTGRV